MRFSDMADSKFLKQSDIEQPTNVTIQGYREMNVGSGDEQELKWVVKFKEFDKPLVLNFTNRLTLQDLFGEDSTASVNKSVEIYVDPRIMYGQQRVGGIRIRPASFTKPADAPAAASSDPSDEIPWR